MLNNQKQTQNQPTNKKAQSIHRTANNQQGDIKVLQRSLNFYKGEQNNWNRTQNLNNFMRNVYRVTQNLILQGFKQQ